MFRKILIEKLPDLALAVATTSASGGVIIHQAQKKNMSPEKVARSFYGQNSFSAGNMGMYRVLKEQQIQKASMEKDIPGLSL